MIFRNQSPLKADIYSVRAHGRDFELGPHFVLGEMACKDGSDEVRVHVALVALLETIRAHFDKPVIINSGYRSRPYNRSIGGAMASKHLHGQAADIRIPGVSPDEVADYADHELKIGGVGRYQNFTHIDIYGYQRRWSG